LLLLLLLVSTAIPPGSLRAQPFAQTCDEIDPQGCRTVVVIGDTQDIADYEYGLAGLYPRRAWLQGMIDWILRNREPENIDFVLQVGDITEHGWWLPMAPGCLQDCSRPDCHCPAEVAEEWQVFDAQLRRLETARIPFALVPGNHDNIRSRGGPLDGPGFSDYFGPARLAAMPGYLESHTSALSGCTASAWQFSLGVQPLIVLGLPDSSANVPTDPPPDGKHAFDRCPGADPEIDGWANELIERPEHREKPVILLHHRLLEQDLTRRSKWSNVVGHRPERFLAGVSGHWEPSVFPFIAERHTQTGARLGIFAPRVDWQDLPLPGRTQPTAASTFAVIRFHLRGGAPDRLEVRSWSEHFGVAGGFDESPDDDGLALQDYDIFHGRDLDGDGVVDDLDLCPRWPGPSGADTDGDGRGDACECGDQDADGRNTVADLLAIERAVFDPSLAGALCDADGDGRCSVSDILAVNDELYSEGNTSVCARQPVPGP
jgi:hypothetical protein